ncbi:MAG: ribosomal RNA small subunit methyltransferase A [Pelagibacteraceae bacterium TMED268]|nr:MAG: ribosomal RNA small subunit methyltransferase A [Pelagibacteraceae bacterium TMED268]
MKIKSKKSLGQNFLIDRNIIKKIVETGNILSDSSVLEVGAGTGNLTEFILEKKPKKLFIIEKDEKLVEVLKERFDKQINIINKDILQISEHLISPDKLIVYGNLPYNISTQILSKWITNDNQDSWYKNYILMFQKEVADRILAKTNSKNYGRLSILSNWKLDVKKIFNISASCFMPKPKIESTLLKFTPKKNYFKLKNSKNLEIVTRVFFNQRRKKIKKPLNQLFKKTEFVVEKLKLNVELRPQNLSPNTFYEIAKEYESLRN